MTNHKALILVVFIIAVCCQKSLAQEMSTFIKQSRILIDQVGLSDTHKILWETFLIYDHPYAYAEEGLAFYIKGTRVWVIPNEQATTRTLRLPLFDQRINKYTMLAFAYCTCLNSSGKNSFVHQFGMNKRGDFDCAGRCDINHDLTTKYLSFDKKGNVVNVQTPDNP